MKQKLLLLTITFMLLGSVSFHNAFACDPKQKKPTSKLQPAVAKKKAVKSNAMPFDLFPFVQTILLN